MTTMLRQRFALLAVATGALLALLGAIVLVTWLTFDAELDRVRSELPARILSRPLELRPGADVQRLGLISHLRSLGYREVPGGDLRPGEYAREGATLRLGLRGFPGQGGRIESRVVHVSLHGERRVAKLRDEAGRRLERVLVEPLRLAELHGAEPRGREPVRLEEIPEHVVDAVLVVEDRRFFEHGGLDGRRILAAAWANLRAGRVVQGGSTITQQLVKNLHLGPERSLTRKLRESVLALWLEHSHAKQEILEAYLNEIYLGQEAGAAIHGLDRAARHYFGKDLVDLELSEAALLAGLIQAPIRWSPFERPEAARARRNRVLSLLRETGRIDEAAWTSARAAPLGVRTEPGGARHAPWFVDHVERWLARRFDASELERGGLTVLTTLDPAWQRAAEQAVARGLARLEARYERLRQADPPLEAALVALDPRDGSVRAFVGGRDYRRSQFDRATLARRQPGSAFKPIVTVAALRPDGSGRAPFTLATTLEDEPLQVVRGDEVWEPSNHDETYQGLVTLRHALEQSLNVPFARLGQRLGPGRVLRTAESLGIESPLAPVPSLALGAFEVTLLELVRAYAVLATGGRRPELRAHRLVLDREGRVRQRVGAEPEPVLDPAVAYLVTSALQGAVDRGTGRRLRALGVRGAVAGKTGSTNDYRDAWFVGYTPDRVVGAWVGFDDGRPVGLPGAAAALPIVADFLNAVGTGGHATGFERPPGIVQIAVDPATGLRANDDCPGQEELFLPGTEPRESCPAPLTRGYAWRLPWRWPRASRRTPEGSDLCRIQVRGLAGMDRALGRFRVSYRVTGEAGDRAVAWLAARTRGGRYVSGPGVRVGAGTFQECVELSLSEPPTRLLAVLEVGERRCADRVPVPGS